MMRIPSTEVRLLVLIAILSLTACTSETRKAEPETLVMQQDVRELISAQKSLTSRLGMLAERLSRMEDRLSVQEARVNVSLPELPVVKLVPKDVPRQMERQQTTAITQGDVEPRRPTIPRIESRNAKSISKRRVSRPQARRVQNTKSSVRKKRTRTEVAQPETGLTEPKGMIASATTFVNERRYDDALTLMATFHKNHARNPLRQYALLIEGRAHFGKGASDQAIKKFEGLIEEFPSGRTVPDALYMIGLSQDRLGQTHRAVETLARLKTIYPATEAGKRAAAALSDRQQSL